MKLNIYYYYLIVIHLQNKGKNFTPPNVFLKITGFYTLIDIKQARILQF